MYYFRSDYPDGSPCTLIIHYKGKRIEMQNAKITYLGVAKLIDKIKPKK